MDLIDPFRKLVVYPSLLRTVRATWNQNLQHSLTTERLGCAYCAGIKSNLPEDSS
jgi:hypothetical protein